METKFIFAIILPNNLQLELAPVRDQFEANVSRKILAHVSLTFPFFYSGDKSELVNKISQSISSFPAFLASIKEISHYSRPNGNIVVIGKVQPEEKFIKINNFLNSCIETNSKYDTSFFPNNTLPDYDPHVTLALDATLDNEKLIVEKLADKKLNFVCTKVSLLKSSGDTWERDTDFALS